MQVNSKFLRFSLLIIFYTREGWLRKNLGDELKLEKNSVIKRIIRMELIQRAFSVSFKVLDFINSSHISAPVSSGKMNDCQAT